MKKKQVLCLALAVALGVSMTACGSTGNGPAGDTGSTMQEVQTSATEESAPDADYDAASEAVYMSNMGNFYETYQEALAAENKSERWALMAKAEAYLIEDAVTVPLQTQGGYYAISRVAPYTVSTAMWGFDAYRYATELVTTEPITTADRDEMKAKWNEVRGTGEYSAWAKQFLTDKGYTLTDTLGIAYADDPVTWDTLTSALSVDGEAICLTYDNLMQYDVENVLQPALAESYDVSEDGTVYTFHLRQGVKWVDSQGREVGEVTADDFVAGMQHMMDAQGGLEYLVGPEGCGIENADAYIYGETTDFGDVGVKAVDDYTVEYTLESPCSFFTTMIVYSVFAPMNRAYYESQGGKFGVEYDASASDYTYGLDPDHIAYCGPYVVTNATAKNKIVYSENESYWNKDNINVKTINWIFEDDSDATKRYNDMKANILSGTTLNTSSLELAKTEGMFDQFGYASLTDATTFQSFCNLNRIAFADVNDTTTVVSPQTEDQSAVTNAAMQNVHFRRALAYGLDRGSYNAQGVGEDLKYNSLRNTIVPGNFVSLEEDVTIEVNGADMTFAAGTYYGQMIQAVLDADGMDLQVWNEETQTTDGFDGWYNPEKAAAELEIAIAELAEEGITIDEENPVYIDLPFTSSVETYANRANVYKQSVEASLGGKVVFNLVDGASVDEWLYAGYYQDYGYEMNYDLYDCSGWAPDYGDPASYLGCFLPEYAGYMTKCFGVY